MDLLNRYRPKPIIEIWCVVTVRGEHEAGFTRVWAFIGMTSGNSEHIEWV